MYRSEFMIEHLYGASGKRKVERKQYNREEELAAIRKSNSSVSEKAEDKKSINVEDEQKKILNDIREIRRKLIAKGFSADISNDDIEKVYFISLANNNRKERNNMSESEFTTFIIDEAVNIYTNSHIDVSVDSPLKKKQKKDKSQVLPATPDNNSNQGASSSNQGASSSNQGASSSNSITKPDTYPKKINSILDLLDNLKLFNKSYREEFELILDEENANLDEQLLRKVYKSGSSYSHSRRDIIWATKLDTKIGKPKNNGPWPKGYANSDLINMYFNFLEDEFEDLSGRQTYEISKLKDEDFKWLLKPKRKRSIFFMENGEPRKKKVIFPANINDNHWGLFYINFEYYSIYYYDSLLTEIPDNLDTKILYYIKLAFKKQYKNEDKDVKEYMDRWTVYNMTSSSPKQSDVHCGFFVMEMAKYIALNWKIDNKSPSDNDMLEIRKRCIFELCNDKLLVE